MKLKGLILLLIAILLFLFIILYEKKLPSTEERKEKEKKIFSLKEENIDFLSFKGKDLSWEVKKEKDEWRLLKPIEYKADEYTINSIVSSIVELEKEKEIENLNLKDFQLDNPEAILKFKTKEGEEEILIGTKIPQINQMSIRVKGKSKNYFISSSFYEKINKNLTDLRDKNIFAYQASDVNLIEIETRKRKISIEKKDNFWYIDFPFKDRAEKDGVEDLLYGLSSFRAKEFIDEYKEEDLKEFNLLPPIAVVSFYSKDKNLILRGEFGKKEGMEKNDFYLKKDKKVFIVNHSLWEKLEQGLVAIPDTKILSFSQWQVKNFKLKIGAEEFTFEKKEDKWYLNQKEVKTEKPIDNILKEFAELKWIKSISDSYDKVEEIGEVKIEGEDFKVICKFYKDLQDKETFWAKAEDRPNLWSFVTAAWKRVEEEVKKLKK